MLDILPNDIIRHISQFLHVRDKYNIIHLKNIYEPCDIASINTARHLACNRIKLCAKICFYRKKLFITLHNTIHKHFYTMSSNSQAQPPRFNGYCVLYSPCTPYGVCRFCLHNLDKHRYDKMIHMYLHFFY